LACLAGIGLLALMVPAFLHYDARVAAAQRAQEAPDATP
jgi:hypothetical protein